MPVLRCVDSEGMVVSYSSETNGEGSLIRYRLSERKDSWSFERDSASTLPHSSSRGVALRTVLDRSLGFPSTFIISLSSVSDHSLVVHSLSPGKTDDVIYKGQCEIEEKCKMTDIAILNGPILVWGGKESIWLALPQTGSIYFTKREVNLKRFITTSDNTIDSIEKFWAFDFLNDSVLLLVRISSSAHHQRAEPKSHWLCLSVKIEEEDELTVQLLQSRHHLPSDYGRLATCVAVLHQWRIERDGDMFSEPLIVIGTSYQQVVVLRGGVPIHCICLDFTPSQLHILQVCTQ